MAAGQLQIDFEYDERVGALVREVAIMVAPHVAPGTKAETVRVLAERVAKLAHRRFKDAYEPREPIRCHTCDDLTVVGNRVRVVVCNRCALNGRSVGCSG